MTTLILAILIAWNTFITIWCFILLEQRDRAVERAVEAEDKLNKIRFHH